MRHLRTTLAALLLAALFAACEEKETAVGIDLVDPDTFYRGTTHTLYPDAAFSKVEDTLRTDITSEGILGNLTDPVYGRTSAILYTQIALPSNAASIDFNEAQVDSVVLSLTKKNLFPDTAATYHLRLEVRLLDEAVETDSVYYSTSQLAVSADAPLFDQYIDVSYTDTVVHLTLDNHIKDVLRTSATSSEFVQHTKGLRIRVSDGEGMMSIDFSDVRTCLTAYYHNIASGDTLRNHYTFLIGYGAKHFMQFTHDYSGTPLAAGGNIDGTGRLYLEALGGHAVHLSFDTAIRAFAGQHPRAVIHYAELLLPLAPEASTFTPGVVMAMTQGSNSPWVGIADLAETITIRGYDGTYDPDLNRFRIRLPRHVQQMHRQGNDPGMLLVLDARRSSAYNTVFNGIADTATAPKIVFVYSE
ncbi:MAG: DUF4270 family protein [Bacteroidales bacterium]|nr:DUF4270 family protein [Bacteroidales bacterium]